MSAAARAAVVAGVLLAGGPALAAKKPLGPGERIDLGRATAADLMRLPGVGEKRAQAILAARAKQPFHRLEDVLVVKGIGPAWLAKVRPNVVIGAAPASPPVATAAPAQAPPRK